MHPTLKIYSLFARVAFLFAVLIAVAVSIQFFYFDGFHGLQALPLIGLIVWLFYMLWWSPVLVVTEQALVAFNVWRKVRIPWSEFKGARLHLGTILETSAGDFRLSTAQPKNRLSELRSPGIDPVPHIDFSQPEVSLHVHAQQLVEILTQWRFLHDEHERLAKQVPGYAEDKGLFSPEGVALIEGEKSASSLQGVSVWIRWHHILITLLLIVANIFVWIY
ncbi:MAG: hypothetical protein Q4D73_07610 [Actinomycetaceae bacterium]|nr:hypothetical protein [Actinomycetaceae bacterium]